MTDHRPLIGLFFIKAPGRRLARHKLIYSDMSINEYVSFQSKNILAPILTLPLNGNEVDSDQDNEQANTNNDQLPQELTFVERYKTIDYGQSI